MRQCRTEPPAREASALQQHGDGAAQVRYQRADRDHAILTRSADTPEPRRGAQPDHEAYLRAVGERVRMTRAGRGMTRKILAAASGVSERYLADLERGVGNASLLVLKDVAEAMGVSVAELVGETAPLSPAARKVMARIARLGAEEVAALGRWLAEHAGASADKPADRIALIGLRGAGKTTLGEAASHALGVPFVELDREIERAAGMELAEIFAAHGQAVFRRLELKALEGVLERYPRAVIATGGSLVTEPRTYDLLRAACYVVCLTTTPEQHMNRVLAQGDLRPMEDNPQAMDDLVAILESRAPLYALADAELDTSTASAAETLSRLLSLLPKRSG
jgi:XRE family aerobic/anaerobic benzoate catabolism transcriptional regulator